MIMLKSFRLLLVFSILFSYAFAQSGNLALEPDGVRIEDPMVGFDPTQMCFLYTLPQPNALTTNGTTYTLQLGDDFKGGGNPATAAIFSSITYSGSQTDTYVLRGISGCRPPGNPVNSNGVYTFNGLLANCRYNLIYRADFQGPPTDFCQSQLFVVIPPDPTLTAAKCLAANTYFDDERKSCMYSLASAQSTSVCGEPSTGLRLDSAVSPGNICYPCSHFGLSFQGGTGCLSNTPTPTPTRTGTPTLTPTPGGTGTSVPTPQPTSNPNPTAVPTLPPVSCGSGCTSYNGLPTGGAAVADGGKILDSDQVGSTISCGSIIETENQILEEVIPLTGTGIALHYSAARQPGYLASRSVKIPITSANPPSGLQSVRLKLQIGNISQDIPLTNAPNQVYDFSDWTGLNSAGTFVNGSLPLTIAIEYNFPGLKEVYNESVKLSAFDLRTPQFIAGWSLSVHQAYDPVGGTLYKGDGTSYRVTPLNPSRSSNTYLPSNDGSEVYEFDTQNRHIRTIDALTGTTLITIGYDIIGRLSTITDSFQNVLNISRNVTTGVPTEIIAPFGQTTTLAVDTNGYLSRVTNPANESYTLVNSTAGLLGTFTSPRGFSTSLSYDGLGRLSLDLSASGESWQLDRTTSGTKDFEVRRSSTLNRTSRYAVSFPSATQKQRQFTAPDGTTVQAVTTNEKETLNTYPDGSTAYERWVADPRFGVNSPFTDLATVTIPGSPALNLSSSNSVTVNPAWSTSTDTISAIGQLTSIATSNTINSNTGTATYTKSTGTVLSTSPEGRQITQSYDSYGRITSSQTPGLEDVTFGYEARGRLQTVTTGSGAAARIERFDYYANTGYLWKYTDALGRVTTYAYDLAGRVTSVILPDGKIISYSYDQNGNLTSLTPPGKPSHTFSYDASDRATRYAPPLVGGANFPDTTYSYNDDGQITAIRDAIK